jgi:hypothetical protein
MKVCEEMVIKLHTFLTLALDGGEQSASYPNYFIPRGTPGLTSEPSDCSSEEKNLCLCWESNPGHPFPSIVSNLLYRICKNNSNKVKNNEEEKHSLLGTMLSQSTLIIQVELLCL